MKKALHLEKDVRPFYCHPEAENLRFFGAMLAKNLWYNTARCRKKQRKWRGRVVWLSALAWKACNLQGFAGSNPALSAKENPCKTAGIFAFWFARPHTGDDIQIPPSPPKKIPAKLRGFLLFGSRAPIQGMTFKSRPLRQRKSL